MFWKVGFIYKLIFTTLIYLDVPVWKPQIPVLQVHIVTLDQTWWNVVILCKEQFSDPVGEIRRTLYWSSQGSAVGSGSQQGFPFQKIFGKWRVPIHGASHWRWTTESCFWEVGAVPGFACGVLSTGQFRPASYRQKSLGWRLRYC